MKTMKRVVLSVGVLGGVAGVLLVLLSLALAKFGYLPRTVIPIISTLCCGLSVFAGAFVLSRCQREKGILWGLLLSVLFLGVLSIFSYFLYQKDFDLASAGKTAVILITGALGGVLGVNRKSKIKF